LLSGAFFSRSSAFLKGCKTFAKLAKHVKRQYATLRHLILAFLLLS
jgi:hypothetical protein